jgi:hypothetical protein
MESAHYKALAVKQGVDPDSLVRRPLTYAEFTAMNEAEKNWHLCENSKAVDAVYADNENEIRELKSLTTKQIAEVFNQTDRSHPAVKNTAANFDAFIARYPQYIHLPIHVADIIIWLRKNSMLPELDNIITAWKALARDGKLKINGSATGLVDETELTGKALEFHPQVNRLLEAVTPEIAESRRVMRMSDSDFKKWEYKNLGPKQIPFLINERVKQVFTTLADRHPDFRFNIDSNKEKLLTYLKEHATTIDSKNVEIAFNALKAAGQLSLNENVVVQTEHATWTGYEQIEGKTYTEKQESLRRKINRMTDPEFVEFVSHSPANRRAVDNL